MRRRRKTGNPPSISASCAPSSSRGGGDGLTSEIEGTGYAANTCLARLAKLLPPTITHSAKAALLAELEARCREVRDDAA